ncbi:MAG: type II toxin-antitoxin system VapC family toxin [Chloroflexota bacterium]
MRLLLDTHVLLWWLSDHGLSNDVRQAIASPANDVAVSAATAWEISMKKSLDKLSAPDDLAEQLERGGFLPLPIRIVHALAAGALPRHHDDPFDRMLIAQATIEGLVVVTADERFSAYDIPLLPM